jgi:hypothetical protein
VIKENLEQQQKHKGHHSRHKIDPKKPQKKDGRSSKIIEFFFKTGKKCSSLHPENTDCNKKGRDKGKPRTTTTTTTTIALKVIIIGTKTTQKTSKKR